jgi:hypothetical protein
VGVGPGGSGAIMWWCCCAAFNPMIKTITITLAKYTDDQNYYIHPSLVKPHSENTPTPLIFLTNFEPFIDSVRLYY